MGDVNTPRHAEKLLLALAPKCHKLANSFCWNDLAA